MRKRLSVILITCFCISIIFSQNPNNLSQPESIKPIAGSILKALNANIQFSNYSLFRKLDNKTQAAALKTTVDSFALVEIQSSALKQVLSEKPHYLRLNIPVQNGPDLVLDLMQHSIAAEGFFISTSSGRTIYPNQIVGLHYWGIVEGQPGTSVAISIFENEVMGLISVENGNIIVGKLNDSDQHIVYNDLHLKLTNKFTCQTEDNDELNIPTQRGLSKTVNCVRLYWEVNNDIFKSKGSITNASNFAMGIFNQSQLMYANDFISVSMSQLKIWDTQSPYSGVESYDWLNSFQDNLTSFNGDLGHLLTYSNSTGGVAAKILGLCSKNWKNKKCFSGIDNTVKSVPVYSWTVQVITHEQGHLMGSPHTHACVWNGNKTAIDGCGPNAGFGYEGSCSNAPIPPKGTTMSYCHLSPNKGIDFKLGFGEQPRDLIINSINNATCLTPCTPCSPVSLNDNCSEPNGPQKLNIYSFCNYVTGTTCSATPSFNAGNSCSISTLNNNTFDVWYSFVATCTDELINVQAGTNFDAVVELYDSPCGTQAGLCSNNANAGGLETINATGLTVGNTYYIRVYDRSENQFDGLVGGNEFQICITSNTCFPNLLVDFNSGGNKLINNPSNIDLSLDIVNDGNTDSGNNSTVYYYLSADTIINNSDYLIGSTVLGKLEQGQHSISNLAVNICSLDLTVPNGNYFIGYVIDKNNEVNESNEVDNTGVYDSLQIVVVNCCVTTATAAQLSSNSPHCDAITINRIGIPEQGVLWYWQGGTCGKSQTLGTDSSYIVSTSGNYYLRAFDTNANCWSADCSSIPVTIGGEPSTPTIFLTNSPQCGAVKIVRKSTLPSNVVWYWQGNVCGTSTSFGTDTIFEVNTSGKYYLRAYNTLSECWSSDCSSAEVVVKPLPSDPGNLTSNSPKCDQVIISRTGTPGANISWYWQGTSCGTAQDLGSSLNFTTTTSGDYYLRAFDATSNCWSENCASTSVSVVPSPNLDPLKLSNKYIIVSPVNPGDKLSWYYNGNQITELNDSLTCIDAGSYYCVVTNDLGCSKTSDILTISSCTVDSKNIFDEDQVTIYPNPANDIVNIQGTNIKNGQVEIILVNALGQNLLKETVTVFSNVLDTQLDLSDLSSGLYFLLIGSENQRQVYKVEKK